MPSTRRDENMGHAAQRERCDSFLVSLDVTMVRLILAKANAPLPPSLLAAMWSGAFSEGLCPLTPQPSIDFMLGGFIVVFCRSSRYACRCHWSAKQRSFQPVTVLQAKWQHVQTWWKQHWASIQWIHQSQCQSQSQHQSQRWSQWSQQSLSHHFRARSQQQDSKTSNVREEMMDVWHFCEFQASGLQGVIHCCSKWLGINMQGLCTHLC